MENQAASRHNLEITIISSGSTSNLPPEIDPAQLLRAAVDGDIEPFKQIPKQLISDIVTPIKNTVLHIHIPSKKVSTKFVEEILGMCPSLLLQVNARGDTPLHVAAKFEHTDVVELLIKNAKAQHEVESRIGDAKQMLRMKNDKGNTGLHEAVRKKCICVVEMLVREDPDFPYSTNCYGETPLYIAVENGFIEAVVNMLQTCTSVSHEGPNGKTTLHAAVRRNNPDLTGKILEKKKSLTKEIDDNGWTPLHFAAYYGEFKVAQQLLKFDNFAAYVVDKCRNMTPLHLAASQGYKNIMIDILEYCPDCNELVDDRGWNALHFAMATLRRDEIFSLLEIPLIKILLHEKDAKGNTPLHVLAICFKSMLSLDPLGDILDRNIGDFLVVNRQTVNAENVFKDGYPELEQEIWALSKDTNNGTYPKGLLYIQVKSYNEFISMIRDSRASHLVVATLITTVTFAAGFTLPGGYIQEGKDEGTAVLSRNSAFQTFVLADTTALILSMCAVYLHFIVSHPKYKKFVFVLDLASWFIVIALGAMVVAFVTGTYAMLTPALGLAIVNCLNGLLFYLFVIPLGFFIMSHYFHSKTLFKDLLNDAILKMLCGIKKFVIR